MSAFVSSPSFVCVRRLRQENGIDEWMSQSSIEYRWIIVLWIIVCPYGKCSQISWRFFSFTFIRCRFVCFRQFSLEYRAKFEVESNKTRQIGDTTNYFIRRWKVTSNWHFNVLITTITDSSTFQVKESDIASLYKYSYHSSTFFSFVVRCQYNRFDFGFVYFSSTI